MIRAPQRMTEPRPLAPLERPWPDDFRQLMEHLAATWNPAPRAFTPREERERAVRWRDTRARIARQVAREKERRT